VRVQPESFDAIVVGAGHNGLVCGAYLARAGLRTLILERLEEVGGTLANAILAPGTTVPALAHTVGRLAGSVVRDLGLGAHGLRLITPSVRAFAPQLDGRAVTLWTDVGRTAHELSAISSKEARSYVELDRCIRMLAGFVAQLQTVTPPDLARPSLRDGIAGVKLAGALRGLDGKVIRTLLRVLPMPVADFVSEFLVDDALRAAVAVRGVQYSAMGPRSAGTAAVLLGDSANNDGGAAGQTVFAAGGPGSLATALARSARSFGARIRTRAEVVAVTTRNESVSGVALSSGEEVGATVVVSSVDPKRTLLELVDPLDSGPTLRWRGENLRLGGVVGKVNLALRSLPRFVAAPEGDSERLRGRILLAPGMDALERAHDAAKYGRMAERPYLEATIPSLSDPTLASANSHVMSVVVQYVPYHLRGATWETRREALGDLVLRVLEDYAPGIGDLVAARQVVTPADLEGRYGLTEGHPCHGEPGLDQFFAWRPLLGHASYRIAVEGLYLCGAGAHPGGGVTGAPGANAAREVYRDWTRRRR
jgi:phytoene dehydrogenase-like protein